MEEENKKINLNITEDVREVVIREGEAEKLPELQQITYTGLINTPSNYFKNKWSLYKTGDKNCPYPNLAVAVNEEAGKVSLFCNEGNPLGPIIHGEIEKKLDFEAFGINKDKPFTLTDLRNLVKRNRYYFAHKDEHAQLLQKLEDYRIETESTIHDEDNQKGSKKKLFAKNIVKQTTISFTLRIPLFHGCEPKTFVVDVMPDVKDDQVRFFLDATYLFELEKEEREEIIQEAIKVFEENQVAIMYWSTGSFMHES